MATNKVSISIPTIIISAVVSFLVTWLMSDLFKSK